MQYKVVSHNGRVRHDPFEPLHPDVSHPFQYLEQARRLRVLDLLDKPTPIQSLLP